jgi:hypothetical protein
MVIETPAAGERGGTTSECMHEACTCDATQSGYCSEYCQAHVPDAAVTCACGHRDCIGTQEVLEEAG